MNFMNKRFLILAFAISILLVAFFVIKSESSIFKFQNEQTIDALLMTKVFGNYDSELKLSIVDSTDHAIGVKHSLSVSGAIFYTKHFINADSNECILITESPSYCTVSEYKKKNIETNFNWQDSLQKLVKKKYNLVCSDCHACGVAMGYYVFHKEYGNWELHESYPKFDRLGAFGRFYGEINFLKIGRREYGLFIESKGGSQGETIRYLRIYTVFNGKIEVAFTKQMYYCNDGAVGKPEIIYSQEELNLLDEYDREMYHRSLDYIEEKSIYELIDRSGDYFDLKLTKQQTDYRGEISKEITPYVFKAGTYEIQIQSDINIQKIQPNFTNKH
ncbi:hypothetical protein ACXR6G_18330 [Ancylomarina sp. YFZ004]